MSDISPLTQALPNSLEELFNTDPELFTGPDDPRIIQIVQAMRADRARWVEKEKIAKAPKVTKKPLAELDLSFDDLMKEE